MIFNQIYTKINSGIIRIPTLVGLAVLIAGLTGGVYLTTQNQTLKVKAAATSLPKNITFYNLSATSASIYWQTDEPVIGFIQAGISSEHKSTYLDDRDLDSPQPHKFHFVTLTNLNPNTTYFYKIFSGQTIYPNNQATFTTLSPTQRLSWNPIVGTILDTNNQPADEALVVLELNNAQSIATITKTGGNFILPLSDLRTADLTAIYPDGQTPYRANLKISGLSGNSNVNVFIPSKDSSLPPVILGKDIDLTQNSLSLQQKPTASLTQTQKLDLNGDGVINATDLSIILKNFSNGKNVSSTSAQKQKADLSGDGIVDQKDVNLVLPYLK